jgi:hypothetical protein
MRWIMGSSYEASLSGVYCDGLVFHIPSDLDVFSVSSSTTSVLVQTDHSFVVTDCVDTVTTSPALWAGGRVSCTCFLEEVLSAVQTLVHCLGLHFFVPLVSKVESERGRGLSTPTLS